jgi:hypothetical protein
LGEVTVSRANPPYELRKSWQKLFMDAAGKVRPDLTVTEWWLCLGTKKEAWNVCLLVVACKRRHCRVQVPTIPRSDSFAACKVVTRQHRATQDWGWRQHRVLGIGMRSEVRIKPEGETRRDDRACARRVPPTAVGEEGEETMLLVKRGSRRGLRKSAGDSGITV